MCKPTVTHLPIARPTGPCGWNVRTYANACAAFSDGGSVRQRIANVLRRWADKAEGRQTIVLYPYGPPSIRQRDAIDALAHGVNAATVYLNDLYRDRAVGDGEQTVALFQPSPPIR